jgi:two-component system sensor histidine kinase MtrB
MSEATADSARSGGPVPAGTLAEAIRAALHEVRRPLALARGYVDMALHGTFGPLDDGLRHPLNVLEGKLGEVQLELEQLALLARLQATDLEPNLESLELAGESRRATDRMRPQADLQDASLDVSMPEGPVAAAANPVLLARILDNLIHNALTYSDGPPRVQLEVGEEGCPFIRIRDHGLGMRRRDQEHAFDRGFRGDPSDKSRPGTGFGLYLSRQAAERMGGTLELEWSQPGEGTSFILNLRQVEAAVPPAV